MPKTLGALTWKTIVRGLWPILGATLLTSPTRGEEGGARALPTPTSPIFFDAQETSFTKDTNQQILEGDVVAIGGGVVIAADRIAFDRVKGVLEAKGQIVVFSGLGDPSAGKGQVLLGDSLTYHTETGDFLMANALMLVNDPIETRATMQRIFGFSSAEFLFEASRRERLAEITRGKKEFLSDAFRVGRTSDAPLAPELMERYAVLIEEARLIEQQKNRSLAPLAPERREALLKRRLYWEKGRQSAFQVKTPILTQGFFRLSGATIERTNGNDYRARQAQISPCLCERDEFPAWSFRADQIDAQQGGYADLSHAVLQIKGIPVLYLPHVTLPLKERRQSGFLLPTFGFQPRSGNIYTQPIYFEFGPAMDTTVTTDLFENRGTRVGAEFRSKQRQYSGWDFRAEAIRDRLWLFDRATRFDMQRFYRDGLNEAILGEEGPASGGAVLSDRERLRTSLRDRAYWENSVLGGDKLTPESGRRILPTINQNLMVPDNLWRGQYGWRGMTFLAPRLSFVSQGEIVSDHRYLEELYAPNDYYAAFLGGVNAKAFSTAKAQVHVDGRDFYLGLGSRYGDNHLLNERFEGQELPVHAKWQTRLFPMVPERWGLPVYGQVMSEGFRIQEHKPKVVIDPSRATVSLGDGQWRRLKLTEMTPLSSDGLILVSQFADAEVRAVEHRGLTETNSLVKSWRTGVEFRLPIDGKGEIFSRDGDGTHSLSRGGTEESRHFVHHLMDWRLRFSARPVVVKDGLYTNEIEDPVQGRLAYFASDRVVDPNSPVDSDLPEEERMKIHRRVSLSTDQVWKLFKRSWTLDPSRGVDTSLGPPAPSRPKEAALAEARRELLEAWRHARTDGMDEGDPWASFTSQRGRYGLLDEYYETPLTLRANIAYDFLDAEMRERQKRELEALGERIARLETTGGGSEAEILDLKARQRSMRLAEPWKNPAADLGLSYGGFRLTANANYSLYLHTVTAVGVSVAPPPWLSSSVSFGYIVGKEYQQAAGDFRVTRESSFGLATSLIPRVTASASVTRKLIDGQLPSYTTNVREAAGFSYASTSECWGLQFLREKDFAVDEANARYLLQLSIIFLGQQRGLPNMSPGLTRQLSEIR